jgi:hypothetical protein
MKYITLIADYTQSCIKDDYRGSIDLDNLQLPLSIIAQLNQWNEKYKTIIPLSQDARAIRMNLINELDKEGIELAEKLRILLDAKVRYFSEGLLQYLDI